ncbi:hypothetical protein [Peijinzhouia sedimentorum]
MRTKRICIHTKDIQRLTGRSLRYSQLALKKMKDFYGKKQSQEITVEEFAQFSGIPEGIIRPCLD